MKNKEQKEWTNVPKSVIARELARALSQVEKAWCKVMLNEEGSAKWYRAKMRVDFYVHRKNVLLKELAIRGEVVK